MISSYDILVFTQRRGIMAVGKGFKYPSRQRMDPPKVNVNEAQRRSPDLMSEDHEIVHTEAAQTVKLRLELDRHLEDIGEEVGPYEHKAQGRPVAVPKKKPRPIVETTNMIVVAKRYGMNKTLHAGHKSKFGYRPVCGSNVPTSTDQHMHISRVNCRRCLQAVTGERDGVIS